MRYIYMGSNAEANPYALPTSRLVQYLKRRRLAGSKMAQDHDTGADYGLGHIQAWSNPVANGLRLVNRLAEEWVRQVVVWRNHRKGTVVISDRHFVIDFALSLMLGEPNNAGPVTERIHRWVLGRLYPRPDLVIFLDAPAELLYERKRDAPMEYLVERQSLYQRATEQLPEFRAIDATGDIDDTVARVESEIAAFMASGTAPSPTDGNRR